MAITAEEIAEVRAHIGDDEPPTDADITTAFDRLGSVEAVALEVIRKRLAAIRAKAMKFTADGDYTEDWSGNEKALVKQAAELAAAVPTSTTGGVVDGVAGDLQIGRFVRAGRGR